MANHLDLEEQEQLDELKHFWKQYGNLITWALIAVLTAFAAWNGYHYWQRSQSTQAATLFEEVDRVVRSGDLEKAERAFSEMKDRFPRTTYAAQAGLLLGKMAFEAGKTESAKSALAWVVENASEDGYATIARLRLSGVLIEAKAYEEAEKVLNGKVSPEFAGLVADRRGDIFILQNKKTDAISEFQKALKAFDEGSEYRRLVDVKLGALGVPTETSK